MIPAADLPLRPLLRLLQLSREWAFDIGRDPQTWHAMCERLEVEHGLFVPPLDPAAKHSWKGIFEKMAAFHALQAAGAERSFAIKVCVRFRPLLPRPGGAGGGTDRGKRITILKSMLARKEDSVRRNSEAAGEVSPTMQVEIMHLKRELASLEPPRLVSLPLHQRLQLIQVEHGGCSATKARRILGQRMCKDLKGFDRWAGAVLPDDEEEAGGYLNLAISVAPGSTPAPAVGNDEQRELELLPNGGMISRLIPVVATNGAGGRARARIGSSGYTKTVRAALLSQQGLTQQQREALSELQAAPGSTATPTTFVEQEVGRWLNHGGSPRRTALATARTELGVLQELKTSLAEKAHATEEAEEAEAEEDAAEKRKAELEWQADEERRRAAVMAAREEILRLEGEEVEEETARVLRDIVILQRELGLVVSVEPTRGPVVADDEAAGGMAMGAAGGGEPVATQGAQPGVLSTSATEVWCADPSKGIRAFEFDRVFDGGCNQLAVYADSAADSVTDLLNGINGCVFAYGQTGSGKSHTMFGQDLTLAGGGGGGGTAAVLSTGSGLVPRCCAQLLEGIRRRQELLGGGSGCHFEATLKVSYVQVYGDVVTDLLHEGEDEPVAMTLNAAHIVLGGSLDREVGTEREMGELLALAEGAKRRAATMMNEHSSRAHSLLFLTLQQRTKRQPAHGSTATVHQLGSCPEAGAGEVVTKSQLCLADLGGSEQVKKSGVSGDRLQEAVNINLGLLSLKNVISHLHSKADYVPFSDNRLTGETHNATPIPSLFPAIDLSIL